MVPSPLFIVLGTVGLLLVVWAAVDEYSLSQAQTIISIPERYEERLIELDRKAVEVAYEVHVRSLFSSWMKDPTDQPQRSLRGVNTARQAYVDSMTAIDRRKDGSK
jgi:hypothetical protein